MGTLIEMASFRKARQLKTDEAELARLERELSEATSDIRFAHTVIEREQAAIKFYQVKMAILKIKDGTAQTEGFGRGLINSRLTIID